MIDKLATNHYVRMDRELGEKDAEITRLRKIEAAAQNLIDQKGRHNTEIAYRQLEAVLKEGR